MFEPVNQERAVPWQPGMQCAVCLTENDQEMYYPDFSIPETYYCETCWSRARIQDQMVEKGLEQNPDVEA